VQTIRVVKKTDPDGSLSLRIPLGRPEAEYEVLVVVQPKETVAPSQTLENRDWPPGYFENTYGSIVDETFLRHPQGDLPEPPELD
jgi:hypothetical protein